VTSSIAQVFDAMVTCPMTHPPDCGVEAIRAAFENDHVGMALIVGTDGRLVTTIERPDLGPTASSSTPVSDLGTLTGRTVGPVASLDAVTAKLLREGRRRLAVVDDSGRLLGLLCLRRDGTGYCSDQGIRARENERRRTEATAMQRWLA
jgi:CBS domain-containing protein